MYVGGGGIPSSGNSLGRGWGMWIGAWEAAAVQGGAVEKRNLHLIMEVEMIVKPNKLWLSTPTHHLSD